MVDLPRGQSQPILINLKKGREKVIAREGNGANVRATSSAENLFVTALMLKCVQVRVLELRISLLARDPQRMLRLHAMQVVDVLRFGVDTNKAACRVRSSPNAAVTGCACNL